MIGDTFVSDRNDDDDVFDETTTAPTSRYSRDAETDSPVDVSGDSSSPSRFDHRQVSGTAAVWNTDAVCRVCSTDDDRRSAAVDDGNDRQPSSSTSVPVDLERRRSGLQRRRLGQLQRQHRLAVDLPEHGFPSPRTPPEEPVENRRGGGGGGGGNFASSERRRREQVVLGVLWNSLDESECQLLVVFVVVLATLATALDIPPAWLVLAVAGLSQLYFVIDDRRRLNSK